MHLTNQFKKTFFETPFFANILLLSAKCFCSYNITFTSVEVLITKDKTSKRDSSISAKVVSNYKAPLMICKIIYIF